MGNLVSSGVVNVLSRVLKVHNYLFNFISNTSWIWAHQQIKLYVQVWFMFLLNKLEHDYELFY